MHRSGITGVVGILATTAALTSVVTAECSRDKLLESAAIYIEAQTSGQLTAFSALFADDVSYQQNNKASDMASGLLSKALKLDHNRTIADTTACATFTELISTAGPYVIGTQLRFTEDGAQISLIDSIVATTGDWVFNAARTLSYVETEDWSPLEEAKRSSRDDLRAAADAYLDMWSDSTAMDRVPWGTPCTRTEGSMHITPSCKVGAPNGGNLKISDRRYVIDEVIGSIDVLCAFGSMPDSHEFRLESGELRLVHTITV